LIQSVIGEIFGHKSVEILNVCRSNRLHVDILRISFIELGCIP
jgi:hypothetical protein